MSDCSGFFNHLISSSSHPISLSAIMEKLQGPINSCFQLEQEDEHDNGALSTLSYAQFLLNTHNYNNNSTFRFEEDQFHEEEAVVVAAAAATDPPHGYSPAPGFFFDEDKIPFLEMLQSVEQYRPASLYQQIHEPNFHYLLRLQHNQIKKQEEEQQQQQQHSWGNYSDMMSSSYFTITGQNHQHHHHHHHQIESCLTNDMMEMASQVKSAEVKISQPIEENAKSKGKSGNTFAGQVTSSTPTRERKKRKRTRPAKNKEEVETQRMTHIAVERNRRRQMNDHLGTLRSLMPPSYVQRGDQASIIGGAIDFVKELEQMVQSLQAQKKMRTMDKHKEDHNHNNNSNNNDASVASSSSSTSTSSVVAAAERKTGAAEVEAVVIQNHANVKVECEKRGGGCGQVAKVIMRLEDFRLTVLHLNITSYHCFVHYSFNLKIEDDCNLRSAEEIAAAVHQIFNLINGS